MNAPNLGARNHLPRSSSTHPRLAQTLSLFRDEEPSGGSSAVAAPPDRQRVNHSKSYCRESIVADSAPSAFPREPSREGARGGAESAETEPGDICVSCPPKPRGGGHRRFCWFHAESGLQFSWID